MKQKNEPEDKEKQMAKLDNCRFCQHMADWQFDDEHKMIAFNCAFWEREYKQTEYCIWVWPDMEFFCSHYKEAGTEKKSLRKLEADKFSIEKENEALKKELSKYTDKEF